jgi:hypothetical protein
MATSIAWNIPAASFTLMFSTFQETSSIGLNRNARRATEENQDAHISNSQFLWSQS